MTDLKKVFYDLARPLGGLQIAKFLSRHHPKIFMYHRVTDDIDDGGLTVDQFKQHVDMLKNEFEPMTLSQLMSANEEGRVPSNAVVVTFDDGYADFAEKAFPILVAAEVPATLFVTTGFVSGDIWLWPDQIRYAITHTGSRKLKLSAINKTFDVGTDPAGAWNEIANFCLTITNEKKIELIEEISKQLKVPIPRRAPRGYEPASWAQIRKMIAQGLDVGSHSICHPILTMLNDEQLVFELEGSKKRLEIETGREIDIICYPNGYESDFDKRVKYFSKRLGYKYGVCAFPDKKPIGDNWCINRYPVGPSLDFFKKNLYGLTFLNMK